MGPDMTSEEQPPFEKLRRVEQAVLLVLFESGKPMTIEEVWARVDELKILLWSEDEVQAFRKKLVRTKKNLEIQS